MSFCKTLSISNYALNLQQYLTAHKNVCVCSASNSIPACSNIQALIFLGRMPSKFDRATE